VLGVVGAFGFLNLSQSGDLPTPLPSFRRTRFLRPVDPRDRIKASPRLFGRVSVVEFSALDI
jgi:hypothetical protein